MKLFGAVLLFLCFSTLAFGASDGYLYFKTPEIDPSLGASALALLSGALLVLRARRPN